MKTLIALTLIASASAQPVPVWPYTTPQTGNTYPDALLSIAQQQLEIQKKMEADLEYARWKAHMEEMIREINH